MMLRRKRYGIEDYGVRVRLVGHRVESGEDFGCSCSGAAGKAAETGEEHAGQVVVALRARPHTSRTRSEELALFYSAYWCVLRVRAR
jgi:nicotinamide mononucleotide (NMN) deamidase PncC